MPVSEQDFDVYFRGKAQTAIGFMYYWGGNGIKKNFELAQKYLTLALKEDCCLDCIDEKKVISAMEDMQKQISFFAKLKKLFARKF